MPRWTRRYYHLFACGVCLSFFYIISDFRKQFRLKVDEESEVRRFPVHKYLIGNSNNVNQKINQLLRLEKFVFLKNASQTCKRENVYLVAFVHSAPNNFEKRRVIRNTWAAKSTLKRLKLKVVFLIGLPNNVSLQKLLDKEEARFSDLVQANFLDSYKNLTLKHLMGYKWVLRFCNSSKFIMKADDDAFIDVYRVVEVLKQSFDNIRDSPRNILSCSTFPEGTLTRREGKWRLSVEEYPYDTFPSYCSGVAYFATPDVVRDLYKKASEVRPTIWIDDLFVTGIVASALRIRLQPLNLKFTYNDKDMRQWLTNSENKPSPFMVADIGHVDDWKSFMFRLWEKTVRVWK